MSENFYFVLLIIFIFCYFKSKNFVFDDFRWSRLCSPGCLNLMTQPKLSTILGQSSLASEMMKFTGMSHHIQFTETI